MALTNTKNSCVDRLNRGTGRVKGSENLVRQCAWCLRLMNSRVERTSALPVAKIYEATHGICRMCGVLWLETVGESNGNAGAMVISFFFSSRRRHTRLQGDWSSDVCSSD